MNLLLFEGNERKLEGKNKLRSGIFDITSMPDLIMFTIAMAMPANPLVFQLLL